MAPGVTTEGADIMWNSIRMIMECKPQGRERETNEQEIEKFSIHSVRNLSIYKRKVNGAYTVFFKKAYCILDLKYNRDSIICKSIYSFLSAYAEDHGPMAVGECEEDNPPKPCA